jgi:hypothetical protein
MTRGKISWAEKASVDLVKEERIRVEMEEEMSWNCIIKEIANQPDRWFSPTYVLDVASVRKGVRWRARRL